MTTKLPLKFSIECAECCYQDTADKANTEEEVQQYFAEDGWQLINGEVQCRECAKITADEEAEANAEAIEAELVSIK